MARFQLICIGIIVRQIKGERMGFNLAYKYAVKHYFKSGAAFMLTLVNTMQFSFNFLVSS